MNVVSVFTYETLALNIHRNIVTYYILFSDLFDAFTV